MIAKDRLKVEVSPGVPVFVLVELRQDWRGMNAHSIGFWRLPLDDSAIARLVLCDIDPEDVQSIISAKIGA